MAVKVVRSTQLSKPYEPRYVVVDVDTEKVLDDAQGWGYKSIRNAHAAWNYKDPAQTAKRQAKASVEREAIRWLKDNPKFSQQLDDAAFYAAKAGDDFGTKEVSEMLEHNGLTIEDFTARDLYNVWRRGPIYDKRKKRKKHKR